MKLRFQYLVLLIVALQISECFSRVLEVRAQKFQEIVWNLPKLLLLPLQKRSLTKDKKGKKGDDDGDNGGGDEEEVAPPPKKSKGKGGKKDGSSTGMSGIDPKYTKQFMDLSNKQR